MPEVSHISSSLVAPVLLSLSTFSCRDEHISAHVQEHAAGREVPLVRSLEHAAEQLDGTKVYVSNVSLSVVEHLNTNSSVANFIVSDAQGNRAAAVLSADSSSMLWQLVPEHGERRFLDFGATVERRGSHRVLSVFKLAN